MSDKPLPMTGVGESIRQALDRFKLPTHIERLLAPQYPNPNPYSTPSMNRYREQQRMRQNLADSFGACE